MGLVVSWPYGVPLVEVFNRKRIWNVLWYRMASPAILLSSVRKAKALAQGSLRSGRGASLKLPEYLRAWTEVGLGSRRPRSRKCPGARCRAWWPRATLCEDSWFLLLLCFLRSEASEKRNRLVMGQNACCVSGKAGLQGRAPRATCHWWGLAGPGLPVSPQEPERVRTLCPPGGGDVGHGGQILSRPLSTGIISTDAWRVQRGHRWQTVSSQNLWSKPSQIKGQEGEGSACMTLAHG